MEQHLIILDLDGTTLSDFFTINEKSKEVIKNVIDMGHIVAIATGRPYRMTKNIYNELTLDTIIANYNGSHIHHPQNEEFKEILHTMNKEIIRKVLNDKIVKHTDNIFAEYKDHVYLEIDDKELYPMLNYVDDKFYIGSVIENITGEVNSLVLKAKKDKSNEIIQALDEMNDISYMKWLYENDDYIEIKNVVAHKALAIDVLCDYYDIPKERTIAIGDDINDLEMVREAGIGVAMKNANPKLIEIADIVTNYTNAEGGVGMFLKEYFKIK